jgi:hypothetical protein
MNNNDLRDLVKKYPPPQSWYDEDMTGLFDECGFDGELLRELEEESGSELDLDAAHTIQSLQKACLVLSSRLLASCDCDNS